MVGFLLVSAGLIGFGQHFYAFYYDLSGGQDLSVNLMNPMTSQSGYQLKVYDANGNLLWQKIGLLDTYEADYYLLSDFVPTDTNSWGVVAVESDELLVIGLEYLAGGTLVSLDTVFQEVPVLDENNYWLGGYYTQAEGTTTGVIVMNPWAAPTSVTVTVYNPLGKPLYQREVNLEGHASAFIDLEAELGTGGLLWGLVDVKMAGQAVVIAMEYYGEVLDIKNITTYYF